MGEAFGSAMLEPFQGRKATGHPRRDPAETGIPRLPSVLELIAQEIRAALL
jgi:hypothetical protein